MPVSYTHLQFFFGEAILQQGLVPLYGLVTILLFCAIYLTYFGATMFLFKRVIPVSYTHLS